MFKQKLSSLQSLNIELNIDKERQSLDEEYRNMHANIDKVMQLKVNHEASVNDFQPKMTEFKSMKWELIDCSFKAYKNFTKSSFGRLELSRLDHFLVSSSDDSTIKMWDVESGECIQTFAGHTDRVRCIVALPNKQLISGSSDKSIKIWDLRGFRCVATLNGHTRCVECLVVLPRDRLVSGSFGEFKLWDLHALVCTHAIECHMFPLCCLVVLPDESLCL